jgi:hypothetical protein
MLNIIKIEFLLFLLYLVALYVDNGLSILVDDARIRREKYKRELEKRKKPTEFKWPENVSRHDI